MSTGVLSTDWTGVLSTESPCSLCFFLCFWQPYTTLVIYKLKIYFTSSGHEISNNKIHIFIIMIMSVLSTNCTFFSAFSCAGVSTVSPSLAFFLCFLCFFSTLLTSAGAEDDGVRYLLRSASLSSELLESRFRWKTQHYLAVQVHCIQINRALTTGLAVADAAPAWRKQREVIMHAQL